MVYCEEGYYTKYIKKKEKSEKNLNINLNCVKKIEIMTSTSHNYNFIFKFIIIGDMGVGKSCLLHQFTEKKCKFIFLLCFCCCLSGL